MRALVAALALLTLSQPAAAQTPRLSNGRLENHTVSAGLATDLPALAARLTEPTWIGYAVPMFGGEHHMCDYWTDNIRSTVSTAPVLLKPADFFFVLYRVKGGQVTRIRSYSADCPLDAGGKAVHWFTNATAADSLTYLKTFVAPSSATNRMVEAAVTAMAMHEGQAALDSLLSLARDHASTKVRGSALFCLAQRAGPRAVGTITSIIENDPDYRAEEEGSIRPEPASEGRRRAAAHPAGQDQQEPGRAQAGHVLARPVEGPPGPSSSSKEVLK